MSDKLNELITMLSLGRFCGPQNHNASLFKLEARSAFEPFGRASETWEIEWRLELPMIQSYWMSATGWRSRNPGIVMEFRGPTANGVIQQAMSFLRDMDGQDIWLTQVEAADPAPLDLGNGW